MEEEYNLHLEEFFISLWKKKKIIIITTIIFALIGCSICLVKNKFFSPDVLQSDNTFYYAQTTFIVSVSQTTTTQIDSTAANSPLNITESSRVVFDDTIVKTYEKIIKSQTSLSNVIQKLNLNIDTNALYKTIAVSRVDNTNLVRIVVCSQNKEQALQIADALMDEFYENMSKLYFIDQVSIIDKAYILTDIDIANMFKSYILENYTLSNYIENIFVNVNIANLLSKQHLTNIFKEYIFSDSHIIELANPNTITILNNLIKIEDSTPVVVAKYTIIFAIIGAFLSACYIITIELFDKSIKNENYINTYLLASITKNANSNALDIVKVKVDSNKLILVSGIQDNDNCAYASDNLAKSFAKSNKKTLLFDLTSNNSKSNFSDYINNPKEDINKFIAKTDIDNLFKLSTDSTISNLDENVLENIISSLENNFDYIVINSNNILENANSLTMSKIVKNTILVVTERKTNIAKYNQAQQAISQVNGVVIGTILMK